jgi:hypothetical protein
VKDNWFIPYAVSSSKILPHRAYQYNTKVLQNNYNRNWK